MARRKIKLCECGCGEAVGINKQTRKVNRFLPSHHFRNTGPRRRKLGKPCECGCGGLTKINWSGKKANRFIHNHHEGMTGHKHSTKTRAQMSKSHTGKKLPPETCEKLRVLNKGRKHTEEHRCNNSKAQTGLHTGEKNNNWQGGISKEEYGFDWTRELKEKIRAHDNHTCQLCDKKQKQEKTKLQVHHIDYNKKNNKEWNLITLCLSCHGKTGTSRESWQEYFEGQMKIAV